MTSPHLSASFFSYCVSMSTSSSVCFLWLTDFLWLLHSVFDIIITATHNVGIKSLVKRSSQLRFIGSRCDLLRIIKRIKTQKTYDPRSSSFVLCLSLNWPDTKFTHILATSLYYCTVGVELLTVLLYRAVALGTTAASLSSILTMAFATSYRVIHFLFILLM